jgi:hypothetical protein
MRSSTSCSTAARSQPGVTAGSDVQPAAGGRSVWVKSFIDAHRCTLREINLAGRHLRGPRPVPCSAALIGPGAGALLGEGRSVIDPASGRVLLRTSRLWAIAGYLALTVGEPQHQLTLTDLRTGTRRALRWPSQIGSPDQAAVDPSAKLIAVSFSDPAYHLSGTQVTDVWLLDPSAGRWQHLPAMPVDVALKFTSMSWTSDGRLGDARADAHQRPGQPRRHRRLATRPEKPRNPIRAHPSSRQRQRQLPSLGAFEHITATARRDRGANTTSRHVRRAQSHSGAGR